MQSTRRKLLGAFGVGVGTALVGSRVVKAGAVHNNLLVPQNWDSTFVDELSRLLAGVNDTNTASREDYSHDTDDSDDPYEPPLVTLDTYIGPPRPGDGRLVVRHALDARTYYRLAAKRETCAIVQSNFGDQVVGWTTVPLYRQELGVFIRSDFDVNTLKSDDFRKIVDGRLTSWSSITGRPERIRALRFEPVDKKDVSYRLAVNGRFAISVSKIHPRIPAFPSHFESVETYAELADVVRSDYGSIAFGLRGASLEGLTRVRIAGAPGYPVNLSVRNTRDASLVAADFLRIVRGRLLSDQTELLSIR